MNKEKQESRRINEALDKLGTDELRLIALYEMYESLEVRFSQPFTERFIAMLNDDEKQLMNRYCAAKIAVLGGNQTLSIQNRNNNKADAQG